MIRALLTLTIGLTGTANAAVCPPQYQYQYQALAEQVAAKHGLPPYLLSALIRQESNFCPTARSNAGAMGLGQLIPSTAAALGVGNPYDPVQNLDGAARYLRQQFLTFKTWPLALAAYNAGPGAVMQYGGIPPYPETQNYVRRVLDFYTAYAAPAGAPVQASRPAATPVTVALTLPPAQVTAGRPVVTPGIQYTPAPTPAPTQTSVPTATPTLQPVTASTRPTPTPVQRPAVADSVTVAAPMTVTTFQGQPVAPASNPTPSVGLLVIRSASTTPAPTESAPFLSTISRGNPADPGSSTLTVIKSRTH